MFLFDDVILEQGRDDSEWSAAAYFVYIGKSKDCVLGNWKYKVLKPTKKYWSQHYL